jgi:isopentenyldiphosphate isomerase
MPVRSRSSFSTLQDNTFGLARILSKEARQKIRHKDDVKKYKVHHPKDSTCSSQIDRIKKIVNNQAMSYNTPISNSKVLIVDNEDNIIASKERCSLSPDDVYRVSALWITNEQGLILLSRRALTKERDPGKLSAAVAGTVQEGETYDGNIKKELMEELGIVNIPLQRGPKVRYTGEDGLQCFVQWYKAQISLKTTQIKLNEVEVDSIVWINKEHLQQLMTYSPEIFIPNFAQQVDAVYKGQFTKNVV